MTDYNQKICEILNDINFFINTKGDVKPFLNSISEYRNDQNTLNELNTKLQKLNNKISSETDKNKTQEKINSISKTIKNINNEITNFVNNKDNSSNKIYINELYDKLLDLNNQIQDETLGVYNKYSNNTDSLISEQNKQYENFKFNRLYLFLFNLGIIFIILRNSYFKKTY